MREDAGRILCRRGRAAIHLGRVSCAARRRSGFTLLEIMVTTAIFSVLLTLGVSNYVRARSTAQTRACVKQIRTLQAAKQQYAMLHGLPASAAPTLADLVGAGLLRTEPACPAGFAYTPGTLNDEPTCASGLPGHTFDGP